MKKNFKSRKNSFCGTFFPKFCCCLFGLVLFIMPASLFAQGSITVNGVVTDDASGEVLPGVNIIVKGTAQGTMSDFDGNYTITANSNAILVFSFIGYQNQEIPVENRNTINVALAESSFNMDEVVVIGYGKRTKGALTGAVGSVDGDELLQSGTSNVVESMQGRVPGLIVSDRGGVPGNPDVTFNIRGQSTFGDNTPLVVIDGVPGMNIDWRNIPANNIEKISVLKDAAAAIYGSRAANGVILIETKKGTKGQKAKFSLVTEYAEQVTTNKPKMMNSYQRANFVNEGNLYAGLDPVFTNEELEHFRTQDMPLRYPDTNWADVIFAKSAPQSHVNLSVQGGTEKVQYFVSGDHIYQKGLLSSGDLSFSQSTLKSNVNVQATKNLKLGVDIYYAKRIRKETGNANPNDQFGLLWNFPWVVPEWPNGLLGPPIERESPLALISRDGFRFQDFNDDTFNAKLNFSYDMSFLTKGLNFSGYANFTRTWGNTRDFIGTYTYYTLDFDTGEYISDLGFPEDDEIGPNSSQVSMSQTQTDFYHARLSYDRSFGDHSISAFAAFETNEYKSTYLFGYKQDLPGIDTPYIWAGATDGSQDTNEAIIEKGRVNYFGAISYNYANKYLVDFSIRHDGSFNFPKDKRFGTFPGLAAGYRISNEPFMQEINWLDDLKFRASYAEMGNDVVDPFQYVGKYEYDYGYSFGIDPTTENGLYPSSFPNPNITWEVSRMQNYGFDVTAFKGLLNMSADYFIEKRENILLPRSAEVPAYTGLTLPDENFGKVNNSGFELLVNHTNNKGKLKYSITGNYTFNRSKVVDIAEAVDVPEWRKQEGHPLNSYVAFLSDGIYRDQNEIDNSPHMEGATQPGDINYLDVDGDGEVTGNDMVRLYKSPIPEVQFGLNVDLEYKNFEFNMLLQGQGNATVAMYGWDDLYTAYIYERRWTPENIDAEWPRSFEGDDPHMFGDYNLSDFWLRDATFVRLKSATIAYNLPKQVVKSIGISGLRFYLQGRNLLTWDSLEAWNMDPEKSEGVGPYPQVTRIMLGANITF